MGSELAFGAYRPIAKPALLRFQRWGGESYLGAESPGFGS